MKEKMSVRIRTPGGQRLEVSEIIGKGVFGKVFSAKDEEGSKLAIKVVKVCEYMTYDECVTETENIEKCINLPFVMKATEVFFTNNTLYIIMPRYSKIPIDTEPELLSIYFYQLLTGLRNMHDIGIIHGDIKRENLMLNERGEICICDLGISVEKKSTVRDICPHVLKSRSRMRKMIKIYESLEEEKKDTIEYPEATPFDDLFATAMTFLWIFNDGYIFDLRVNNEMYPKNFFKKVLELYETIDIEKRIAEIIDKKCVDKNLADFFKEYLTRILTHDEENSVLEIKEILEDMIFNHSSFVFQNKKSRKNYKKIEIKTSYTLFSKKND